MYGDSDDSAQREWQRQQETAEKAWRERDEAAAQHAQSAWREQNEQAARGWRERDEACQRSAADYEVSVRETLRQTDEKREKEQREEAASEAKDRAHRAHHDHWNQVSSSSRADRAEQRPRKSESGTHHGSSSSDGSLFGLLVGAAMLILAFLVLGFVKSVLFGTSPTMHVTKTVSYADFSNPLIGGDHVRITPRHGFEYNSRFPNIGSWRIVVPGAGFHGTFVVPVSGRYDLVVTHLTSLEPSCPGRGYSPVTIRVNSNIVAANYDAAADHGGTHGMVTDSWPIVAHAGENTFEWISGGSACTHYWIQRIEIQSAIDNNEGQS
jgi:hypothetical protein